MPARSRRIRKTRRPADENLELSDPYLALLWQIVFSPLFFTDLLSAIWALLRRRPKDEIDDGVT
ncbi:hypothetical protein, partial [Bradyrhizobium sp. LeoA1S1]